MGRKKSLTVAIHVILLFFLALILFPFYWMIMSSFKNFTELFRVPPSLFPPKFNLEPYLKLFTEVNIGAYFKNSLISALLTSFCTTLASSIAAYSLAFYRYRARVVFSRLVLFIYMFPQTLVVIPLYILMTKLGLVNTRFSVIITYVAFNLPIAIHVLKAYFLTLPYELIDASLVDGLTKVQALFRIILPIVTPGIAAAAVFAFIGAWNEFLFANTFLVDEAIRTFPVVIVDFNTREAVQWNQILAASTLIAIPSFLFASFAQRYLVSGLSAGSVKE